jgi:hypothetical protein
VQFLKGLPKGRISNIKRPHDLPHQIQRMRRKKNDERLKRPEEPKKTPLVLTVGHSTRLLEDFTNLLKAHGVKMIVDVRTVPRSGHNPQFNLDTVPEALRTVGIEYEHMSGLGGLRHARSDSFNMGWHNLSFRGFADYMQTEEFEKSLHKLIRLAQRKTICLMCAEAVPWRCHRSLIADALQVRGLSVEHIMNKSQRQPHKLTAFALVDGTRVIYPALNPNEIDISLSENLSTIGAERNRRGGKRR